ncbi:hypothetical protein A2680_04620 [Candidatus Kaiserbacteria bacterium RIFCSPHIGHO2_01_FULL_55_37]|nr:MAG: hypothetical protein A2680_04620 [Candidatus Kaiserbacteria bacterium RIFCSPHIGHO2_01_FULL_55_37]
MRLRNLLILVCVLALAAVAAFAFWSTSSKDTSSYTPESAQPPGRGVVGNAKSDTDPYDVLITYTTDGYSPRDITIEKGKRVRFLNKSSEETWPASGIHPTHTLYPEKTSADCLGSSFDSCAALKNGEFFDFTFNYPGTWNFHDHLHPYDTGSITVTDEPPTKK